MIIVYSEILTLLGKEKIETVPGQGRKKTRERREVFARSMSIGQMEFYQAQAQGLKPEMKFELADYLDYADEKEIEYEGKRYSVLRTYRNGRRLEITVYGGVNNADA